MSRNRHRERRPRRNRNKPLPSLVPAFVGLTVVLLAVGAARYWLVRIHDEQHRRTLEAQARYDSAKYQPRPAPPDSGRR